MLLGDVQHKPKIAIKDKYMSEIAGSIKKKNDPNASIASTVLTSEHGLIFDICLALTRSAQSKQVRKVFQLNRILAGTFELN